MTTVRFQQLVLAALHFIEQPKNLLGHAFERVRSGESVGPVTWYLPLARNGDFACARYGVVYTAA